MPDGQSDERSPLLQRQQQQTSSQEEDGEVRFVEFGKDGDPEDPRQWPRRKKMLNVFVIALMAIISPLAASMFSPAVNAIARDLDAPIEAVIGAATGYVLTLGVGPIILAPMSETFGRRAIYFVCYSLFCALQIPTALSPNVEVLIALRITCGFLGSCGVACGGGTINDMFEAHERASVFGWYLLGPVLGPTIGPLFGGLIAQYLGWRWIFWIATVVTFINLALAVCFLQETFAPVILERRCQKLSKETGGHYTFPGQDTRPLGQKVARALVRPIKILTTQPVVIVMALYQAVLFSAMFSLYNNIAAIYTSPPYNMTTSQVGGLFIFQGTGFLIAAWFIVPRIDTIYNHLTAKNNGISKPEFRLPLANVGAILMPVTLLWFGWAVEFKLPWLVSISSLFFYGIGQVCIFNTVQNYYIDAFATYSASAIAAGAFVRAMAGGLVPIASPAIFRHFGYGWGWTIFSLLSLALAPSPWIFMKYGEKIRTKYSMSSIEL